MFNKKSTKITNELLSNANIEDISFLKGKKDFLKKHGNTDSFLLLDPESVERYCFIASQVEGYLGFGVCKSTVIVLGGLICKIEDHKALVEEFKEFCASRFRYILFFNIYEEDALLLKEAGFELIYEGDEALIRLNGFDVGGRKKKKLRQAASMAARKYRVREVCGRKDIEKIYPQLVEIDNEFFSNKLVGEMRFFVGNLNLNNLEDKRLFIAESAERVEGYIFCFPMYPGNNYRPELYRKRTYASGALELLFIRVIKRLKEDGSDLFSLGLCPAQPVSTESVYKFNLYREFIMRISLCVNFTTKFFRGASGFDSLRGFKGKFRPEWTICYTATYPKASLASQLAVLEIWGLFEIRAGYILKFVAKKIMQFIKNLLSHASDDRVQPTPNSALSTNTEHIQACLNILKQKNADPLQAKEAIEFAIDYIKSRPYDMDALSRCLELAKTCAVLDKSVIENLVNETIMIIKDRDDVKIWSIFIEFAKRRDKDVYIKNAIKNAAPNIAAPMLALNAYLKQDPADKGVNGIYLELKTEGR